NTDVGDRLRRSQAQCRVQVGYRRTSAAVVVLSPGALHIQTIPGWVELNSLIILRDRLIEGAHRLVAVAKAAVGIHIHGVLGKRFQEDGYGLPALTAVGQ